MQAAARLTALIASKPTPHAKGAGLAGRWWGRKIEAFSPPPPKTPIVDDSSPKYPDSIGSVTDNRSQERHMARRYEQPGRPPQNQAPQRGQPARSCVVSATLRRRGATGRARGWRSSNSQCGARGVWYHSPRSPMRWPAELSKSLMNPWDRTHFQHQWPNVGVAATGWSGALSLHIENCWWRRRRGRIRASRFVPSS